jgi:hypothetical protein
LLNGDGPAASADQLSDLPLPLPPLQLREQTSACDSPLAAIDWSVEMILPQILDL